MIPVTKHLPLGGTGDPPVISGYQPEMEIMPIDEVSGVAEIDKCESPAIPRVGLLLPIIAVCSVIAITAILILFFVVL